MVILQHNGNRVEVLDTMEVGGVRLAMVRALDGKPYVGGDRWPIRTEYATVKACELQAPAVVLIQLQEVQL